MKLKRICQKELIPTAPFDFDSTFHKPDHFTSGDNYWEKGIRWQTWWWEGIDFGDKFRVIRDIIDKIIISEGSGVEVWAHLPLPVTITEKLGYEPQYRNCRAT